MRQGRGSPVGGSDGSGAAGLAILGAGAWRQWWIHGDLAGQVRPKFAEKQIRGGKSDENRGLRPPKNGRDSNTGKIDKIMSFSKQR